MLRKGLALGLLAAISGPSLAAFAQAGTPSERTIAERFAAANAVTVRVERWVGGGQAGHGSGVIVSANGLVVTAGHVVADRQAEYRVVFPDGRRAPVRRVHRHPDRDLALLRTGRTTPEHVRERGEARVGAWLVCAGFGASDLPTRTLGVLIQTDFAWTVASPSRGRPLSSRTIEGTLRSDCPGGQGMSGGPVLGPNGELIGIVVGEGVAEPVEGLVRWAGREVPLAPATPDPLAPQPVGSRAAALMDRVDVASAHRRSVVLLRRGGSQDYYGVVASESGYVVTVAEALGDPPEAIEVVDQPRASAARVIAVAGELLRLRFDHLVGVPGASAPGALDVGALVVAVTPDPDRWTVGVVNGIDRSPGRVLPQIRQDGCGTMQHRRRLANPAVEVGLVLSHDAGVAARGALLLDREGAPAGIHVVSESPAAGYAVPWAEVLRRFPELRLSDDAPVRALSATITARRARRAREVQRGSGGHPRP